MDSLVSELMDRLPEFADISRSAVKPTTRLYHDAGLGGDDYYEFLEWIFKIHGVNLDGLNCRWLSPPEAPWFWEREPRTYIEVTLDDVAELILAGSWADSRLSKAPAWSALPDKRWDDLRALVAWIRQRWR